MTATKMKKKHLNKQGVARQYFFAYQSLRISFVNPTIQFICLWKHLLQPSFLRV